jgi:hypothetical protein
MSSYNNIVAKSIWIGSLVIDKTTKPNKEVFNIKTLTIKELHLLNKHPVLRLNPVEIFLSFAKSQEEDGQMGLLNDIKGNPAILAINNLEWW